MYRSVCVRDRELEISDLVTALIHTFPFQLFWTPLFDTLPLDAVVGRCLVLEPSIWCKGRPRLPKYREDDIFICEYRVYKSQRFFEKIAQKNRYYINTERYIFDHYEERLRIKRNFTVRQPNA